MSFAHKNVLVTGASRGIGRAIASRFAEQGARVVVHYHQNRQAAEKTLVELPGAPISSFRPTYRVLIQSEEWWIRCFKRWSPFMFS